MAGDAASVDAMNADANKLFKRGAIRDGMFMENLCGVWLVFKESFA